MAKKVQNSSSKSSKLPISKGKKTVLSKSKANTGNQKKNSAVSMPKKSNTVTKKQISKVQKVVTSKTKKNSTKQKGIEAGFTREEKTDFTKLYTAHRKQMDANGCDIDAMIKLRQKLHSYPENGFEEHVTIKLLGDTMENFGIDRKFMKKCAKTGLYVDIMGTGAAGKKKNVNVVALRTDLDGLPMPENNQSLPYKTQTKFAHMCGHDGHMACLMAAAQVITANRSKMPSNQGVRLLLQPAEEGPGGALPMVKENCLAGVDEVYGFHNIPNFDEGDIRVCEGAFFAAVTVVQIKIKGQGGHGSTPHKLIDPISAANAVYSALHTISSRNVCSRKNFVFTICNFSSGTTYNVFPDEAIMKGTIRTYDSETQEKVISRIKTICNEIAGAMECKAELNINRMYPAVVNHALETQHVKRLATKWFGPEHVSEDDLPITASEDFSYFIQERPGCFFALGTRKPGSKARTLHTSDYDFNDDMVATGGYFWVRLVEDRLGVKLLKE